MAAYRRVDDSRHLQTDCQKPGSAPVRALRSVIEYGLPFNIGIAVTDALHHSRKNHLHRVRPVGLYTGRTVRYWNNARACRKKATWRRTMTGRSRFIYPEQASHCSTTHAHTHILVVSESLAACCLCSLRVRSHRMPCVDACRHNS